MVACVIRERGDGGGRVVWLVDVVRRCMRGRVSSRCVWHVWENDSGPAGVLFEPLAFVY